MFFNSVKAIETFSYEKAKSAAASSNAMTWQPTKKL
jgi:hypothetical protein